MDTRFLKGQIIINSLRDNGYTNTAYALAELIDNSIQAKATRVQIGFIESFKSNSLRTSSTLDQITVWDNGEGMSPETLIMAMQFGGSKNKLDQTGMGKFGMGLPSSSVSQCKRVEVWSWLEGSEPHFTYLDVDEMNSGNLEDVPDPTRRPIPSAIAESHFSKLPKSGTLVIWSKLDRINWKTGKSVFKHCEYLVGRLYRRFIDQNKVLIKAVTYQPSGETKLHEITEYSFKANDPLYLMKATSLPNLPGSYSGESFFEVHDEEVIPVQFTSPDDIQASSEVIVRSSIVKKSAVDAILSNTKGRLGSTEWGKHCAKNIGVSVVRAGRELALKSGFLNKSLREYKGRFIGVEVEFPPALDHVFGVTNNKQDAVNLVDVDFAELAEQNGFDLESEYENDLKENNDNYLIIRQVTKAIKQQLETLTVELHRIPVDGKLSFNAEIDNPESKAASDATVRSLQREARGHKTESYDTPMDRDAIMKQLLEFASLSASEAAERADSMIKNNQRYYIERRPLDSSAFFDVSISRGCTMVLFNTNHVFHQKFISKLAPEDLSLLELAIAGFARVMNEETNEKRRSYLNAIRRSWGGVVADFISDDTEDDLF